MFLMDLSPMENEFAYSSMVLGLIYAIVKPLLGTLLLQRRATVPRCSWPFSGAALKQLLEHSAALGR